MTSKSLIQCLILFVALLMLSDFAAYAQNKQSEVVFEITREGAGMIFPLKKQVYFRLYDNGLLEYETLPVFDPKAGKANFDFVINKAQVEDSIVVDLLRIAEKIDFQNAAENYKPLSTHIDAIMVTSLLYKRGNKEKRIVITNYNPKEEKARSFYPPSLIKLLQRIVELRPKTKEENESGTGGIY